MPGPLRALARTAVSFVSTRAQLAANELEEQVVRLLEILLWLAAAAFFAGVALLFVALVIVLAFWDSNRLLAAGLLATLFAAAAAGTALVARACMRERPKFLAATLAELRRDGESFGGKDAQA